MSRIGRVAGPAFGCDWSGHAGPWSGQRQRLDKLHSLLPTRNQRHDGTTGQWQSTRSRGFLTIFTCQHSINWPLINCQTFPFFSTTLRNFSCFTSWSTRTLIFQIQSVCLGQFWHCALTTRVALQLYLINYWLLIVDRTKCWWLKWRESWNWPDWVYRSSPWWYRSSFSPTSGWLTRLVFHYHHIIIIKKELERANIALTTSITTFFLVLIFADWFFLAVNSDFGQTKHDPLENKRSLQNHRTRIHKNLFAAIGIQVIIRMTLYMDQVVFESEQVAGITNGPTLNGSTDYPASGIHQTVILIFLNLITKFDSILVGKIKKAPTSKKLWI